MTHARAQPEGFPLRHATLAAAMLASTIAVFFFPPTPQPLDYHHMADARTLLGIPNALNVLSNLPFAIVGVLGLALTLSPSSAHAAFRNPWERWPYVALFTGIALTAAGSSYYHLAPDNARLVWDRLPMTVGFMGLLTAVFAERIGAGIARALFLPLLVLGAASVGYWAWTEAEGRGDLRLYGLVQFGSLLAVVLMLGLYRSTYTGGGFLIAGLTAYAAAKLFELADDWFFQFGRVVSGHTLKHVSAAGGVACLLGMLRVRRLRSDLKT
jgi:hypothetical protein